MDLGHRATGKIDGQDRLPGHPRSHDLVTCALGCLALDLRAQTTTPAAPAASTPTPTPTPNQAPSTATAAASSQVTKLAQYTVSDVPLNEQVLPTVRPVGDVMGDDRNILDIPRSLTAVDPALMEDRLVRDAMDLQQFSSGVYAAAQYGIPAVPYIRGDLSQIYMGGQQIPFSRNSTPHLMRPGWI